MINYGIYIQLHTKRTRFEGLRPFKAVHFFYFLSLQALLFSSDNVGWFALLILVFYVLREDIKPPGAADSSLAVLDFLRAQSAPPAALWAVGSGFFKHSPDCCLEVQLMNYASFAPRDFARPAAPLVDET